MSENAEDKTNTDALAAISKENTASTPIEVTKTTSHNSNVIDDTPRIICNELLVKPQNSTSLEKLDELSSLEREIAKMHHVEDETNTDDDNLLMSAVAGTTSGDDNEIQQLLTLSSTQDKDLSNGDNEGKGAKSKDSIKSFEEKLEDKLDAITSGENALEHEDLIAVLKGLDTSTADDSHNISGISVDPVLEEGVTIEGEGEYQIMEVIDDDSNAAVEDTAKSVESPRSCEVNTTKTEISPTDQSIGKKNYGQNILTAEEERALALEQMEVLKIRKKHNRRRKQDIKPIKQVDPALDLVSALEADWSENDDDMINENPSTSDVKNKPLTNISSSSSATATTTTTTSKTSGESKSNTALITSVVVIPTQAQIIAAATVTVSSTTANTTNTTTAVATSKSAKDKESPISSPVDGVIEKSEDVLPTQTGFRRTRIIKRKIIWDPDAPETTFSYAKLVKPNSNNTKTKAEAIPTTTITKGSTTITPIKRDPASTTIAAAKKVTRPTTPKDKKLSKDLNVEKKGVSKSNTADTTETTKSTSKTEELTIITKTTKTKHENSAEETTLTSPVAIPRNLTNSPVKRRSQTPVANGPGGVKKKKITEIDRLMGDEGAVNMLNSLEKLEATMGGTETKATRPMMRSRAATICEKIPLKKETASPAKQTTSPNNTNADSPTTTTTPPTNQPANKGKRTNKSRASSTWDYVYKKKEQNFDDSLIIRRRSNSSYSSTTSLNRSSLDGPPPSITNSNSSLAKTNDTKSSSPASTTPTSSTTTTTTTKTPPSSSNLNKSAGSSKGNSTPPSGGKSFEFAKPENKKTQRRTKSPAATLANDMKKTAPAAGKRNVRSPANATSDDNKDVKLSTKSPPSSSSLSGAKEKKDSIISPTPVSDVVVKKSSKVAQIIFSTNKAKISNTFTIQMLNKLVDILDKLASDPDCHVVVMATNDAHFCQGVDVTELTRNAGDKRKNYATHLATAVKNYLKTLATYPKPLIAGVNGSIMNLGVIQLALFDIVIAGDKTTYEAPYVKMGQPPEGYCIWNNMNKIRGSFKTKIFWLCERIQSTEAALAGLVNKLTSANKVNEEAYLTAKRIATYSVESYRSMKKTVTSSHLDVIATNLNEEFDTIIKQWSSNECLENMKKYVEQGHY